MGIPSLLIYKQLERLGILLRKDARVTGSEMGLLPVQLEALHYLGACNRYSDTPLAVAEFLAVTSGSISQTLNVLVNKGLALREYDQRDRRVVHYKLTAAGEELLANAIPAPLVQAACALLGESDLETVTGALGILLSAFHQSSAMKSFGTCHNCRHHQAQDNDESLCALMQESLTNLDMVKICREFAV
jgi:DNA-binding MarR family transcriptional regulator